MRPACGRAQAAEALAKAEASFRIAGVSYRQGATSLLELQEAQRTQGFQGAKFHVNKFNVLQIIVQIILMKKGI